MEMVRSEKLGNPVPFGFPGNMGGSMGEDGTLISTDQLTCRNGNEAFFSLGAAFEMN